MPKDQGKFDLSCQDPFNITIRKKPYCSKIAHNCLFFQTEAEVFMVGPQVTLEKIPRLDTTNSSVDIDLIGIAKNNNPTSM